MCHICRRLNIVVESKPPELAEAEEAEEEARVRRYEEEMAALRAQGKKPPPAPRKQLRTLPPVRIVVEPAPSHDGAPTFAAYAVPVPLLEADEHGVIGTTPPVNEPEKHRPQFGMRIYDTRPVATAEDAALLAPKISALTREGRRSLEGNFEDRIEVVALPCPTSTTADERAARCIAHNEAERAVRLPIPDPAVSASWYIAEDLLAIGDWEFRKRLWVIDDLQDAWEDALRKGSLRADSVDEAGVSTGHCLVAYYGKTGYDSDEEYLEWDHKPRREFFAKGFPLEELASGLGDFVGVRGNVYRFYLSHFVPDRVLDRELALARAAGAGLEVPRPVVIPYHERKNMLS